MSGTTYAVIACCVCEFLIRTTLFRLGPWGACITSEHAYAKIGTQMDAAWEILRARFASLAGHELFYYSTIRCAICSLCNASVSPWLLPHDLIVDALSSIQLLTKRKLGLFGLWPMQTSPKIWQW